MPRDQYVTLSPAQARLVVQLLSDYLDELYDRMEAYGDADDAAEYGRIQRLLDSIGEG